MLSPAPFAVVRHEPFRRLSLASSPTDGGPDGYRWPSQRLISDWLPRSPGAHHGARRRLGTVRRSSPAAAGSSVKAGRGARDKSSCSTCGWRLAAGDLAPRASDTGCVTRSRPGAGAAAHCINCCRNFPGTDEDQRWRHRPRTDRARASLIALTLTGTIGVWGWIGIVPVATAALGFCPLYTVLGFSSCPMKKT
jgi:hypothetical protein